MANRSLPMPFWQEERGERYGNRRKDIAKLKVRDRRKNRRCNKKYDTELYLDALTT